MCSRRDSFFLVIAQTSASYFLRPRFLRRCNYPVSTQVYLSDKKRTMLDVSIDRCDGSPHRSALVNEEGIILEYEKEKAKRDLHNEHVVTIGC